LNDAIGLIIILSFIMIAGIFVILAIDTFKVHGQDIDPRYYCMYHYQYPFNELCHQQQINELYDKMIQKAEK